MVTEPFKILIVDDEPRNIRLLEAMLRGLGHELIQAHDGPSAVAIFESAPPDLVILDLVMPGMDGIAVLTRIRASHAHIPVIVATAHSENEHRLRAVEAGADEFLEKPIDRAILLARVRTLLALKASRDELAARHEAIVALQREQRDLMQLIVHDLRTPLAIAQSGVEFANDHILRDPTESGAALTDAAEGLSRIRDLVEDMLIVSRLEQAAVPVETGRVDVGSLVTHVTQAFLRRARSQGVSIDTDGGQFEIRADRRLLARVLQNLVDNSLRHTPHSGRVEIAADRVANDRAIIAVSNSGPPIPVDDRERIFEKLARGRSPSSRPGAFGLGLYFCRRAVEAQGGRIWVGTRSPWPISFLIDLPAT